MKTYRAALVSIITAMTLIVSGCGGGGGKVDEALAANCELLRANLAKLTYTPKFTKVEDAGETFDYLSLSVDGYFSGNVGVKARVAARQLVVDNHPYLADFLSKATGNEYSLDNTVRLAMLEEAIKGTGFTLSLTDAQKQNTKGDYTDPSHDLLEKELIGLGLETDYDSEIPLGCAIVDEYKYSQRAESGEDFDGEDYLEYKWSDYEYSVEQGLKLVGIANTCEKTGEFNSRECGKKDYISTQDYSSTPSTPVNPWERDWSSTDSEIMAKTVWCITNGYSDYNKATDGCK
jgi:hypothetical protein